MQMFRKWELHTLLFLISVLETQSRDETVHVAPSSEQSSKRRHAGFTSGIHHIETLSWGVELLVGGSNSDADTVARACKLENCGAITENWFLLAHVFHDDAMCLIHDSIVNKLLENVPRGRHNLTTLLSFNGDRNDRQAASIQLMFGTTAELDSVVKNITLCLDQHSLVVSHIQEVVRPRQKRALHFKDPKFKDQWHLVNRRRKGFDVNVTGVWERNITGLGVTVAVVDDGKNFVCSEDKRSTVSYFGLFGIEWRNPDLRDNYNAEGSWDLNDKDSDPTPHGVKEKNHHGTRCAGEIAAVANTVCGVGVAYQAGISGLRVLDGPMTDSLEATAFTKNMKVNDIYSCSWGPDDDGKTIDGPHHLAKKALQNGINYGRGGYGAIYVVASGNGGRVGDNCNFDGYANSIYTLTIGAVDEAGGMPYYAEECASMLAVTFSSGSGVRRKIVTTDWMKEGGNGCTSGHTGTSAAAPLAAAMVALMLEARSCLTWRDVQYIIVLTAVKVDVGAADYYRNAAGLSHSTKHGFGSLNAWRLVNTAKVWPSVPFLTSFSSEVLAKVKDIPGGGGLTEAYYPVTAESLQGYSLNTLEYVQVTVWVTHLRRGDLELKVRCPSYTESVIGASRTLDDSKDGFVGWTFSTVRCWGESPLGTWTLIVQDTGFPTNSRGQLVKWQLQLFGSQMTVDDVAKRRQLVEQASSGDSLRDDHHVPCQPPPLLSDFVPPIPEKWLKILLLTGCFCVFMVVYETLEYAFCYNKEKKEHAEKMRLAARAARAAGQSSNNGSAPSETAPEEVALLDSEDFAMDTIVDSLPGSERTPLGEYRDITYGTNTGGDLTDLPSNCSETNGQFCLVPNHVPVGVVCEEKVDEETSFTVDCERLETAALLISSQDQGQGRIGQGHSEGHDLDSSPLLPT